MTSAVNSLIRRVGATGALATTVAVMLLILVSSLAYFIWYDRNNTLDDAAQRTSQAARTLEEHTLLSLRAVERLLDRVAERIIAGADRRELDGLARSLLQVGSLWYLDTKGDLLYTSFGPGVTGNYADREYFRHSSQHDGAYVGPMIRGRQESGNFFTVSKRVVADGVAFGVILAGIDISYWSNLHATLGLHPDSVIAVFRNDGRFIAREPLHERAFEQNVSQTSFFRQAQPTERAGVFFDSTSSTDGITRIVAHRPIKEYGLFVIASESRDAALADWRRRARWALMLGGATALLILALGVLAWRFARLEEAARRALASKAAELERALDSTELLHRELQHRTKNNLQLVTTLLHQGAQAKDPAEAMRAAIARVTAIGRAYTDAPGSAPGNRAQCRTVIGDTVHALTSGQNQLHVDIHIDDCTIPIEKAAPLALIVNEALTNAIKYGVSDTGPSRIGVRARLEDGTLHVEVRDNGPGLPSTPSRSGSTGLRIIDGLARQINATYELFTDGGAVFRLRMDLEPENTAARVPA